MIVDFRVRPPFKSFAGLDLFYDRSHVDPVTGSIFDMNSDDAPSRREKSMEYFMKEMDEAGVDVGVAIGRAAAERRPGRPSHLLSGTVRNDDVAELVATYPGRFVGIGGVSGSDPRAAIEEIHRCKDLGLVGVAFDNPLSDPPLYDDDESLMPIYEECGRLGMLAVITASLYIGSDITYSDPVHVQRIALALPDVTFVVPHASWPWVAHMCGIASLCKNIYLIPDVYWTIEHMPGAMDYVNAANVGLYPRMLYGSTYPTRPLGQSVRVFKSLPFKSDEVQAAILGQNAARLLGLEV